MKFQLFTLPVHDDNNASQLLNSFCSQHRVTQIEKHFVADAQHSFWSICVTYVDSTGALLPEDNAKRKKTIDYKEVLNEDDFSLYAQLRDLRKTIAERDGTPPYNVFTNEQLANIIRKTIVSKTDLLALEGIGQTRVDKYGELFIEKMKEIKGM